jgi:predicted DNA-binding transcriptional regulator AlpA
LTIEQLTRRFLRTKDAAQYLGLANATLERYRVIGDGPRFSKLGRAVVYARDDLDTWVAARQRTSTSATDNKSAPTP